ncbi:MAG: hypothetical protein ACOVMN_09940 [Flexibacteraceae bacterium]
MKKYILGLLVSALSLSFVGCSDDSSSGDNNSGNNGGGTSGNQNLITATIEGVSVPKTAFVSSKNFVSGSARGLAPFVKGTAATISNDTLYIRGIGDFRGDSMMVYFAIKLPAGNRVLGIHPIRYDRNTVAEQGKGAVAYFGNYETLRTTFNPYTATVSGELEITKYDTDAKTLTARYNFSQTIINQTIGLTNGSLQNVKLY